MPAEKHDTLETWQLAVGIATGLIGLLYYTHRSSSSSEPAAAAPVGPAGFGEVAGGGGGLGSVVQPPKNTGEAPPIPVGAHEVLASEGPAPGEGQREWEIKRYNEKHRITFGGNPPRAEPKLPPEHDPSPGNEGHHTPTPTFPYGS